MTNTKDIALQIPEILLPNTSIDLFKWAVIACDQFTSEPEYWHQVAEIVGDAPSTYHMILPEVFLETPEEAARIRSTHAFMQDYLNKEIFTPLKGFIDVHRTVGNQTRRGLVVSLDLEHYDYGKGAQTLIRATEGTIVDRLPPRIRIRQQAPLECPHILVLFDDPLNTVFGLLDEHRHALNEVYNFELMLGSGHLQGFAISDPYIQSQVQQALANLIDPDTFAQKYGLSPGEHRPLLFAMGDGNHSLATAKSIWEDLKPTVGMDHPARYALVEIENVHDPALSFEPIHRLLFGLKADLLKEMYAYWGDRLVIRPVASQETLVAEVTGDRVTYDQIGLITPDGLRLVEIHEPDDHLPVGSLQRFLDAFLDKNGAEKIDYVHGTDVLFNQGSLAGNTGFYLPGMNKSDLFKTVILDGALPRKTFSMGEAKDKRFYLECRQIQPV
jgi:hypothetical protein